MGIRALIVDDSAVMRSMIISTLRRSAVPLVTVHQAGDGEEALEVLSLEEIDLVLIDLDMPRTDGAALYDAIRVNAAWGHMACVLVSSDASATHDERWNDAGAAFVLKPFTPEGVRSAVLKSMRVPRS